MVRNTPWWLPGAALVLFGFAIVIFPDLLALIVASAFITVGATWLTFAYNARKLRQNSTPQVYRYEQWRWF